MATPTYELIDSTVLGSSAASLTFSSLPATYRDLIVVINASHDSTGNSKNMYVKVNNDSSNYSAVLAYGYSAGNLVESATISLISVGFTTDSQGFGIANIMDYSATDKHKTFINRLGNADGAGLVSMVAGRWASTSAINQLEFYFQDAANFNASSSIYIYGIEA